MAKLTRTNPVAARRVLVQLVGVLDALLGRTDTTHRVVRQLPAAVDLLQRIVGLAPERFSDVRAHLVQILAEVEPPRLPFLFDDQEADVPHD